MVTTIFKGGMGNQMFQYAIGRIIAEHKGHKLSVGDPDNVKHKMFDVFKNAALIDGREDHNNPMTIGNDLQYFDLEAAKNHQGAVVLYGYWQKHYYYTKYRDQIRQWFTYDDSAYEKPNANDLVLHVRLGDQLHPEPIGLPATAEAYVDLIKRIPHERCLLISDEPDEPWLAPPRAHPTVKVRKGTQMEDFTLLKYAKKAIISQSTFAWWATYLGEPEKIWAPLCADGRRNWRLCPAAQDIDLIPMDNTYQIFKI